MKTQLLCPPTRSPILSLVTEPARGLLLSTDQAGNARLWSETAYPPRTLKGHRQPLTTAIFGAKRLYTGSQDMGLRVYDLNETGSLAPPTTLLGHLGAISAFALDRDETLYSGALDGTIRVWSRDLKSSVHLRSLTKVHALLIDKDGSLLIGCEDGIWRWRRGHAPSPVALQGNLIHALFQFNERLVATTQHGLYEFVEDNLVRQSFESEIAALTHSSNGNLAILSRLGEVYLLPSVQEKEALASPRYTRAIALAFSPCGETLAIASDDARVTFWSTKTRTPVARSHPLSRTPRKLAFLTDSTLALGLDNGSVALLSDIQKSASAPPLKPPLLPRSHRERSSSIEGIALTDQHLALLTNGCLVIENEGEDQYASEPLHLHAITATREHLCALAPGQGLHLFEKSGQPMGSFEGDFERITAIPEREIVLCSGGADPAHLFLLKEGKLAPLPGHHTSSPRFCAATKAQRLLTFHGEEALAKLWNTAGELVADLQTPGHILDLQISPDERHALTICDKGSLRVWRMEDGALLGETTTQATPSSARFSDKETIAFFVHGDLLRIDLQTKVLWKTQTSYEKGALYPGAKASRLVLGEAWQGPSLFDLKDGALIRPLDFLLPPQILSIDAWLPDQGDHFVLWSSALPAQHGALYLYELSSGERIRLLSSHPRSGTRFQHIVPFPKQGWLLSMMRGDPVARLWDIPEGNLKALLDPQLPPGNYHFSIRAKRLAMASGKSASSFDLGHVEREHP